MEHDFPNEVIDRLTESGMEEIEAVRLVTLLLEQEAYDFVMTDQMYSDNPFFPLTRFYS